ncbi:MAG: hypothetical protein ACKVOW_17820 [Chitinophagaceae bacterium]
MKPVNKSSSNRKLFIALLIGAVVLIVSSCAKKINFQTSAVVPAARGTVKVKKDNNQNYVISISLFNLAEAKRLPTNEQTYVVWMESNNQPVKNLGQINSSTKLLSKTLKASLESVSPVRPTKIFITVENNSGVQYPGNELVLTTNRF